MSFKLVLTTIQGPQKGQEYVFTERATCLIGRGDDCVIRLPQDAAHRVISRHHCMLEITPPAVRLCDFRSLNGTYINGRLIGKREKADLDGEHTQESFPQHELQDGDEVQLSRTHTVLKVHLRADAEAEDPHATSSDPPEVVAAVDRPRGPAPTEPAAEGWESLPSPQPRNQAQYEVWRESEDTVRQLLERSRDESGAEWQALREWEYVRLLGVGGMGAVALLRRPGDGARLAFKIMRPRADVAANDRERFRREVENTKALDHPHVVRFWFSQCVEEPFFFALEYCPGGSLAAQVRRRGGRLPVPEAVRLVLQALDGLAYAHQADIPFVQLADGTYTRGRGLVHRDLKPDNLFLTGRAEDPVVKIGDFGLAKAFDLAGFSGFTQSGLPAGSAGYMPRQQARNCKYLEPDADVWAMAATLYFLLSGVTPRDFHRGNHPLVEVLEQPVVPLRERAPDVPAPLADLVDEALTDEPAIRFRTVAAFQQRLRALV
jgi:hypothetical protein